MKKHKIKQYLDLFIYLFIYLGLLGASTIGSFGESLVSDLKCVSLNNQPCKARPTLVNINTDETLSINCKY